MTVEIVREREGLASLAPAWLSLEAHAGHPTLSFDWQAGCAESFSSKRHLELLTVSNAGSLVGIAPLVSGGRSALRKLELLGVAELHEPSGFIYRDDDALDRLCQALVSLRRPVILERIDSEGPLPAALFRAARGHGRLFLLRTAGAPFLDLSQGWESLWAGISSRRRHDFRRARRLLEREGSVSVEISRPKVGEVETLLTRAFTIEACGWKARRGSALALKPGLAAFFSDYARRAAEKDQLVMSFLCVGGRSVAMQIAVVYARKYWLLKIGHDEAWSKQSPGMQLITETLRWACDASLAAYEFLGSDEPWLGSWRPGIHPCCSLVYYPYVLGGGAAFAVDAVGVACRRLLRGLRVRRSSYHICQRAFA